MIFRSRKLIMPKHLNAGGSLFGGQALSWIDEEAAIFAACKLGTGNIVTAHVSEINFTSPAKTGNVIEIGVEEVSIGIKSLTLKCVIRNKTTKEDIVTVDKIVFVTLDENGNSCSHKLAPMGYRS
jgi:acyl-CoA thioesterase YciA